MTTVLPTPYYKTKPDTSPAFVWGDHTPETDPTRKGWVCYAPTGVSWEWFVIGQADDEVCAIALWMTTHWDVFLFWDGIPLVVRLLRRLHTGLVYDLSVRIIEVENEPGWAMSVIDELAKERKRAAIECEG